MILDSSAVVAIIKREPGYESVLEKMSTAPIVLIAAPTLVETGLVLQLGYGLNALPLLLTLLNEYGIQVIPFSEALWPAAINASRRFGKGRHPAGLNFGDCMTYASARVTGLPLLRLGNDFAQTDLLFA